MGVVWQATDTLIERAVAIKELRPPAGDNPAESSTFVERALREARHAGQLNHPNVVAVHDVIAPSGADDAVYIVMEFVHAPSLAELLDRGGPIPSSRAAVVGLGILDALDAAHARGIVHRDVKPANVLVAERDRAKLTDFGIALAAADSRLTRSGVIGTQAYLAPECFDAGEPGPAADLWALGATLYHAVTGRAPFDRDTTSGTLRAILFEDVPVPPDATPLGEAVTGLLTRPVEQRIGSAAARELLQPIAADVTPTAADDPDLAPWEAHPTRMQRPPSGAPPAPLPPRIVPPAAPAQGPPLRPTRPPGTGERHNGLRWLAVIAVLVVVAGVLAAVLASSGDDGDPRALPTGPAVTAPSGLTVISGVPANGTFARGALDTVGRFVNLARVGAYHVALELSTGAAQVTVQAAQQNGTLLDGPDGREVVDYEPKLVRLDADAGRAIVTLTLLLANGEEEDADFQVLYSNFSQSWQVTKLPSQILPD